jgi:eukaryotic-like serine/threonine-protein kinase
LKASKIDLVLGDGKESYQEEAVDSTATPPAQETTTDEQK